ncbi:uncharacterized protein LOC124410622 [Diprion similis]|uniref:uncharacterized protein LOC124410622 n=1 Tax=Diprion similis TaxID=362088 RepID=UPI001EF94B32|nr:uncharacterized protein LOC124410622 [Diprion similis]
MWRFTVALCFCFAAQRSFAQICEPVDVLDTNVLARTFAQGARSLAVPTLEENDHLAGEFRNTLGEAVAVYGRSLVLNIYDQMKTQGKILIDVINELADELQFSIQTFGAIEAVCSIGEVIDRIFKQFKVLLALSPGPGRPAQPPLPPIPVLNVKVHPVESALSLDSLFVNYNATLEEVTRNLYAYTGAIFVAGWNSVWSYYDIYGLETRNEILNDKVLDVYRRVASQINYQCDFIKTNVNPDLWESYKCAADRIEAEWNAYQLYKSQVTCLATF